MSWLLILFVACVFVQLIYYLLVFGRLAAFTPNRIKTDISTPVSVVICARSEGENLQRCLPQILEQDYPEFEVLVVNHASTDNSGEVLKKLQQSYSHLRVLQLEEAGELKGKKQPLKAGIEAATHDYLLLTDADCRPASKQWIKAMVTQLQQADIVLGYGPLEIKPGVLNKLQRYENYMTALQYLSYSLVGKTYMGVGRNLAYRKEVFNTAVLEKFGQLQSGDDDLSVSQLAQGRQVPICTAPESFMYSPAPNSLKAWLQQKQRHMSTGPYYKPIHLLMLGLYQLTAALFWLLSILLLCQGGYVGLVLLLIIFRFGAMQVINSAVMPKLNQKDLLLAAPILEIMFHLYYIVVVTKAFVNPHAHWK